MELLGIEDAVRRIFAIRALASRLIRRLIFAANLRNGTPYLQSQTQQHILSMSTPAWVFLAITSFDCFKRHADEIF